MNTYDNKPLVSPSFEDGPSALNKASQKVLELLLLNCREGEEDDVKDKFRIVFTVLFDRCAIHCIEESFSSSQQEQSPWMTSDKDFPGDLEESWLVTKAVFEKYGLLTSEGGLSYLNCGALEDEKLDIVMLMASNWKVQLASDEEVSRPVNLWSLDSSSYWRGNRIFLTNWAEAFFNRRSLLGEPILLDDLPGVWSPGFKKSWLGPDFLEQVRYDGEETKVFSFTHVGFEELVRRFDPEITQKRVDVPKLGEDRLTDSMGEVAKLVFSDPSARRQAAQGVMSEFRYELLNASVPFLEIGPNLAVSLSDEKIVKRILTTRLNERGLETSAAKLEEDVPSLAN